LASEARDVPGAPLPLYVSLKTFDGGSGDTLLEMAADANQIDYSTLRTLWSEPRQPICLLLDGGDETAYRDKLIEAIGQVAQVLIASPGRSEMTSPDPRSLVVACRPGPLQAHMATLGLSWQEFLLMPLCDRDIDAMLTRFDAASLVPVLPD